MMEILIGVVIVVVVIITGLVFCNRIGSDLTLMDTKMGAFNKKADRIERKLGNFPKELRKELEQDIIQIKLQLNDIEKYAKLAKDGAQSAEDFSADAKRLAEEIRDKLPAPRKRNSQGKFIKREQGA